MSFAYETVVQCLVSSVIDDPGVRRSDFVNLPGRKDHLLNVFSYDVGDDVKLCKTKDKVG